MKKILLLLSMIAIFVSCGNNPQTANKTDEVATVDVPALSLADFDAQAGKLVDQEINITGIVDHVCKQGGKRLFLVDDFGTVHIDGDERFDESLTGSNIVVRGIVKELRIDEAYCLKMEEDQIQKHKKGLDSDELYAQKMEEIKNYRDSMQSAGVDHLSFYTIDYVSHTIK